MSEREWVDQHEGGSTTMEESEKKKDRLKEGVSFRERAREEKDSARVGRPVSAAAASH